MSKNRKILIIAVVCVVLVAALVYLNHPYPKYKRAVETFNNRSFSEAKTLFEAIPNYRDSDAYIRYLTTLEAYEAEEYEKAEAGFASLGDFLDSKSLAEECVKKQQVILYEKAQGLFEKQEYREAGAVFGTLGAYEQAAEYAAYCEAMTAFEDGEYRKAGELFVSVTGFKDADHWAEASDMMEKETIYRAALEAFEDGNNQEAIEGFRQISGYEDASQYILYIEGKIALSENKFTAAATAFGSIKGFKDAEELEKYSIERQLSMQYQEAVKLFKKGDYQAATTAFSAITDYADSESYILYMSAMNALSEERYPEAIQILRGLGSFLDSEKHAEQAQEQYNIRQYNVASAYYEDENYEDALRIFTEIGDYRDASAYASYISGMLADAEADYAAAEQHYLQCSDFKDAAVRAKKSHKAYLEQQYALALEQMDAGEYETARIYFERVDGYRQAAEYLTYIDGQAALAAEDYLTAEACFAALGDFLESTALKEYCTEQLKPFRYAEGIRLLEAGSYEEAREYFEQVSGYEDADRYSDYALILQTAYVGDYRDAIEMLGDMDGFLDSDRLIIYFEGRQAEIDLDYESALEYYESIDDFKDCQKRIARIPDLILDRDFDRVADKLTGHKWWNQALTDEVRAMLSRKYQMTNTTVQLKYLELADELLDAGDFEHSYELVRLVADDIDAASAKLADIQYLYALTEMETDRPEQAEWMLSELAEAGYPDAEESLISCLQMLEEKAAGQGDPKLAEEYHKKIESVLTEGETGEESPAIQETPGMEESSGTEESPAIEESPVTEEPSVSEETPMEETPAEESPVTDEMPAENADSEEAEHPDKPADRPLLVIDPALYEIPGAETLRDAYHDVRGRIRTLITEYEAQSAHENAGTVQPEATPGEAVQ